MRRPEHGGPGAAPDHAHHGKRRARRYSRWRWTTPPRESRSSRSPSPPRGPCRRRARRAPGENRHVGGGAHEVPGRFPGGSREPTPPPAAGPGWYEKKCAQRHDWARPKIDPGRQYTWRAYDAVGPETMTLPERMRTFAVLNGRVLHPVFVDYRNFETVLNVASLGNLNRQFVSLLRSERWTRSGRSWGTRKRSRRC